MKSSGRAAASRWLRYVEGWPLALVAVGMAIFSVLLASPRGSIPDVLPLPEYEPGVVATWRQAQHALAETARRSILPRPVRAIGEAYRSLSYAASLGLPVEGEAERMRVATRTAIEAGLEADINRLRAVQTEMFLDAVARWTDTGLRARDLDELAGDFLEEAKRGGWLAGRRLRFDDAILGAMFQVRWTHLAGLLEHPRLQPELVVWQQYYTALLRDSEGGNAVGARVVERQLAYIDALCQHDPDYPRDFARGVLFYRAQRLADAEESFRRFLANPEHQRWRLRARNHWLECRELQGKY